ncbi:MAG: YihY family inner membrane protein [Gammaproteobacteria bacterium]|nr:YihY family inner membrane protein [Gammaproteobacteria bacterium]
MKKKLQSYLMAFYVAGKRFWYEQYSFRASSLAFTTLLAIVPLMSVFVFFIATFPIFSNLILLAEGYILQNFVPDSGASIEYYFQGFIHQASRLPVFGIILLFISAMLLINTIEETLNDIWKAPRRKKHLHLVLLYWSVLLSAPLILGLGVFLTSYFISLNWVASATGTLGITSLLLELIPILINTILFALLYTVIPNMIVSWRVGLFGGFVAAILFQVAHYGFTFYFVRFDSYQVIYGAFAAIPIFLIWLYIFWFIILYGALVSQALAAKEK